MAGIITTVALVVFSTFNRPRPPAQAPAPIQTVRSEAEKVVVHVKEARRIEAPFVLLEDATAAGGLAAAVPPKAGIAPGALLVPFSVPRDGKYSIWLRAYWGTDGEGSCSDSLSVAVDGGSPRMVQDASYNVWHWLPLRSDQGLELKAGDHSLLFTNREDGIKLDQVFITPWSDDEFSRRVPQGIE